MSSNSSLSSLPSTAAILITVSITHVVLHLLRLPLPVNLVQLVPVGAVGPVQAVLVQVEGEYLDSDDMKCYQLP